MWGAAFTLIRKYVLLHEIDLSRHELVVVCAFECRGGVLAGVFRFTFIILEA